MKKIIICIFVLIFTLTLTYVGIGCKPTTPVETTAAVTERIESEAEESKVVAAEEEIYIFPGAAWSEPFWTEAAWGALRAGEQIGAKYSKT